ncbi:MAG: hypothetical protein E7256_11245 [Lachnospiraceae bacterium]|nr:hypothetical protein [Lachnospiraceae bacterium]
MIKKVFLVDYENTSLYGLKGISELRRGSKVVIFHSSETTLETLKDILKVYETQGIEIRLHALKKKGRFNALDFMICTYLGYEVAEKAEKEIYILSADRGYESAITLGTELNSDMKVGFERSIYQCLHKKGEEIEVESNEAADVEQPMKAQQAVLEKAADERKLADEIKEFNQVENFGETENENRVAESQFVSKESESVLNEEKVAFKESNEAKHLKELGESQELEQTEELHASEDSEDFVNHADDRQEDRAEGEENVIPLHADHKKGYRRYANGRYRYSKNNYHRSAYRERQSCRNYMQRKMERDNIIPKQYHNQLISFMDKACGRHEFEDKAIKSLGAKNGMLMGKAVMYYEQYQSYKERQSMYY